MLAVLLLFSAGVAAQPVKGWSVKNGRMYIQLPKPITETALDSFIVFYDLADLNLKAFLKTNKPDSLQFLGWRIDVNNEAGVILSKAMEPFEGLSKPEQTIFFHSRRNPLFPAVNNGLLFGVNRFRHKHSFRVLDSTVRFFLRNHQRARKVMLAGSFNNWVPDQLSMQRTDSGWIFDVKLGPGKWWYKFIVDGNWIVDRDNQLAENDGLGNINSVFFRPNVVFSLPGFAAARAVFLAGSFNQWQPGALPLQRTAAGWQLPLYLAEGTHTYKFVADGKWLADPQNAETVPDGEGGMNSVIRRGTTHVFRLPGHSDAREVMLVGSFNQWREFEWKMKRTPAGWELPFTLGPGNYQYKFRVDGRLLPDPANAMTSPVSGNSYLVLRPNFVFRLKGFGGARSVFVAGDFNGWDPAAFAMKKEGEAWVLPVHLAVGKHRYKFVVDGKWITDPDNELWEQNGYDTGNSVLWVEN